MIYPYNQAYIPPFPAVEVTFASEPLGLAIGPLPALVDTGTDVTTVPVALLEQIQALYSRPAYVRPHWGERQLVYLYLVDARIGPWTFPALEVVGDDNSDEILVGRDLLDRLWVALDGNAQSTEIRERTPGRRGR